MTSKISVERQFHFHCSCGAITITGERTVTCTGCGITLGVRRVRTHRQRSDTVTYYGGTFNCRTIPVRRVEKRRPWNEFGDDYRPVGTAGFGSQ